MAASEAYTMASPAAPDSTAVPRARPASVQDAAQAPPRSLRIATPRGHTSPPAHGPDRPGRCGRWRKALRPAAEPAQAGWRQAVQRATAYARTHTNSPSSPGAQTQTGLRRPPARSAGPIANCPPHSPSPACPSQPETYRRRLPSRPSATRRHIHGEDGNRRTASGRIPQTARRRTTTTRNRRKPAAASGYNASSAFWRMVRIQAWAWRWYAEPSSASAETRSNCSSASCIRLMRSRKTARL